jgi:hypothetical protein
MLTHLRRLTVAILVIVCAAALASVGATAANLDEACGGKDAITCNSALWCHHPAGQCKTADAAGKCEKAPAFCMRVSRPVCGCNGKTYANDCERRRVKVQLDHDGACKKESPQPAPPSKKRTKGA